MITCHVIFFKFFFCIHTRASLLDGRGTASNIWHSQAYAVIMNIRFKIQYKLTRCEPESSKQASRYLQLSRSNPVRPNDMTFTYIYVTQRNTLYESRIYLELLRLHLFE